MLQILYFPVILIETHFFQQPMSSASFTTTPAKTREASTPLSPHRSLEKRAADGCQEGALLSAFRTISGRLQHLAKSILGNRMEAEDAVQEAFCKMWERHAGLTDRNVAAAMLTTTVRHVSINCLRRKSSTQEIPAEECADCIADADTASEVQDTELRWQRIQQIVFQELSPEQQHILKRRDYEGDSFENIAQEMGVSPAYVRVNLSRARKKILLCYRQRYRDYEN